MTDSYRSFLSLPRSKKMRILRRAATDVAVRFGLGVSEMRFHSWETNALFRLSSEAGQRFMLRLASPGWRSRENLVSEALWLRALEDEPEVRAPRILATVDGALVPVASAPGHDIEWNATLMSWQPGRLLGRYLTPQNLKEMGRLFARLHIQAAAWERPPEFSDHLFDRFLSRGEPNVIAQKCATEAVAASDLALLERTEERVRSAYESLDRADIRVIHCDLWHDNIKLYRGELYPFDFEDTILGFRLHDIAMAMLDLLDDTGADAYPGLLAAFRSGYSELLSWPEGEMEVLQAGRILWIINYVARFDPSHLSQAIEWRRTFLARI